MRRGGGVNTEKQRRVGHYPDHEFMTQLYPRNAANWGPFPNDIFKLPYFFLWAVL